MTEEKKEVQNEAKDTINFKKTLLLCLVAGTLITPFAIMHEKAEKRAAKEAAKEAELKHLTHVAECFENVMGLNSDEITLVFDDPGRHYASAAGITYIDETYVGGLSSNEDVIVRYFSFSGADYYAVSDSEKLDPYKYNGVTVSRNIQDDDHFVKFDSYDTSLKSIDVIGIYNKGTNVLYVF